MQQLVHTRLWRYERLGKWWVDYLGHTLFMFHISGFHRYIYTVLKPNVTGFRTPQSMNQLTDNPPFQSLVTLFIGSAARKQTARRVSCEKDLLQGGSPNRMCHVILDTLFQVCSTLAQTQGRGPNGLRALVWSGSVIRSPPLECVAARSRNRGQLKIWRHEVP